MDRRTVLRGLLGSSAVLGGGYLSGQSRLESPFGAERYEGPNVVVDLDSDVTVERVVLYDSSTEQAFETDEYPSSRASFRVVFPTRMESYVDGLEVLEDSRARFDIESQAPAPVLVRFVGITGAAANPTVDVQDESFDVSGLEVGPGVGENRPSSPRRSDLVVPGGDTKTFETLYAPFEPEANGRSMDPDGGDRRVWISLVDASGVVMSYSFTR